MKYKIFFILCFFQIVIINLYSQNKYAILIGIDKYSPPSDYKPSSNAIRIDFRDLDGCKNDARSMASVIASKFAFPAANIDTLFDEKASREAILKSFNDLLNRCKKGDVAFIYYAGHGSQMKNSKSSEGDGKDETFVPSDTWKEGVSDIRDKEFAIICNRFLDKGIKLTVITDCCHSGSLSRGPIVPGKFRYIASGNFDSNDPSRPTPPETRSDGSFLIISAAQDNEFAQEQKDDKGDDHGAFTIALLTALNQQTVDASALNLFTSLRAILKGNGKKQEPIIGGAPERQRETLFGLEKGTIPDKSLVPVIKVSGSKVELQGGIALSLNKGNELLKVYNSMDSLLLSIDSVTGINRSQASVIKGNIKNIQPGQLFEVTNWVSSSAPLIKLYIPGNNISQETVNKLLKLSNELKASKKVFYLKNIGEYDPTVTIYFEEDKCFINNNGIRKEITDFSEANVLNLCKNNDSIFIEIPPTQELYEVITTKLKNNKSLKLINNSIDAHYVLYGVGRTATEAAYGLRRTQVTSKDSLESMLLTTNLVSVSFKNNESYKELADSVFEYALKLSKIRGWMNLISPTNAKINFPFTIKLKHAQTQKILDPLIYKVGEKYDLNLVIEPGYKSSDIPLKYVYVFIIDQNGTMQLIYPSPEDGNVENKFPHYSSPGKIIEDFKLYADLEVYDPIGFDNFFLLATNDPISNYPLLFNQDGVGGIDTRGGANPLSDLINMGNETKTRGIFKTPSNWCLIRLSVKSIH